MSLQIKDREKCPYRLKTELVVFIEIENREKCRQQDELDQIKSKNRHFFYKLRCKIKIYLFEKPLKENVVTNVTC